MREWCGTLFGGYTIERIDTMSPDTLICRHCGNDTLIRYGIAPNGKQKYRCHTCGKQSRANPTQNGYDATRKEEILRAYEERSSLRGLERTFGVSRNTVTKWLKKSRTAPAIT